MELTGKLHWNNEGNRCAFLLSVPTASQGIVLGSELADGRDPAEVTQMNFLRDELRRQSKCFDS